MRKSIPFAAVALVIAAAQFPFSDARADTPSECHRVHQQICETYEVVLSQIDQAIASQRTNPKHFLKMVRWSGSNPLVARFLEEWDDATTIEGKAEAFRRFEESARALRGSGAAEYMTDYAQKNLILAIDDARFALLTAQYLDKLRTARADIQAALDVYKNAASAASTEGAYLPGQAEPQFDRTALHQQKHWLERLHAAQAARVAAFTPIFLARRQALLAALPAETRGTLESSRSRDWAGRASVTYTRLKIRTAMQAAADEGRQVPEALVALDTLYGRMSGYHSALLDSEAKLAQVDKGIAHTVVDERAYALHGEGGSGGEGGGEGGH